MRTVIAFLLVTAAITASLLLTGSAAFAQSPDNGATTEHYDQCEDGPYGRVCSTGVITVRTTPTPSGATSGSMIDNGRFEFVDSTTGCTTTGSYHLADVFRIGPAPEHVVIRNSTLDNTATRCGDEPRPSRCLVQVRDTITVVPGAVRLTSRVRSDCN